MKKYTSYAMTALLCVVMAGAAFAAIWAGGGTENFESVGTLADGDQLSAANIGQISGWTLDPSSGANLFFFYDNNDTSAFTTASGAGTKPAGPGNMNVKYVAAPENSRIVSTGMTLTRQISISGWFAVAQVNYFNNVRVGIWFPDAFATPNKGSIHFEFLGDNGGVNKTKDIGLVVRSDLSASASNETLNVGSSDTDDTDFALNEWNSFQINITSSDSAEGSAELILNGATIGSIAVKADSAGNMLTGHCFFLGFPSMTECNLYIDDIVITTGSSVDDWILF